MALAEVLAVMMLFFSQYLHPKRLADIANIKNELSIPTVEEYIEEIFSEDANEKSSAKRFLATNFAKDLFIKRRTRQLLQYLSDYDIVEAFYSLSSYATSLYAHS
mgnify:CR=1 FL=1